MLLLLQVLGVGKERKECYFLPYGRRMGENNINPEVLKLYFRFVCMNYVYVEQTVEETICLCIVCVYPYPDQSLRRTKAVHNHSRFRTILRSETWIPVHQAEAL